MEREVSNDGQQLQQLETPALELAPADRPITMRHPHTGDTVQVTQAELPRIMNRGYEQVKEEQQ